MRTTRASLRILTLLAGSLDVRPERVRAGFSPGVFATDRALQLVASGMPFRDAYQQVRANLDALADADPDAALAAKTGGRGTADVDFAQLSGRVAGVRHVARTRLARSHRAFARLLAETAD